ncbi:hypothetical protein Csa_022982 [Cucumis sativus]|nr:hypothetical protein Csa_022982 [Cucumis sativus]
MAFLMGFDFYCFFGVFLVYSAEVEKDDLDGPKDLGRCCKDVSCKPEEYYVTTRKCESNASARVVQICERLRDESGHIIMSTQPICCPCGAKRRTVEVSMGPENRTVLSNDNFLRANLNLHSSTV